VRRCPPRLAAGLVTATPLRAEVLPVSEMLRGSRSRRPNAAAIPADRLGRCDGPDLLHPLFHVHVAARTPPVVFLAGRPVRPARRGNPELQPSARHQGHQYEDLIRFADSFSRCRTTAIYLARIAWTILWPSSGAPQRARALRDGRRTRRHQKRHQFKGSISSTVRRSTLVGGLLALRKTSPALCRAQPAAQLNKQKRPTDPTLEAFDPYDPSQDRAKPRARVIVVTIGGQEVQVQHQPPSPRAGAGGQAGGAGHGAGGRREPPRVVAYARLASPCARRVRPRKRSKTRLSGWSKGGWLTPRTGRSARGGAPRTKRSRRHEPRLRIRQAHRLSRTRQATLSAIATTEPSTADHRLASIQRTPNRRARAGA